MRRLAILAFALVMGCDGSNTTTVNTTPSAGWERADLAGRGLVAHHGESETRFRYDANGDLLVTILTDGEPPVAPLMYWEIDSTGYLIHRDDQNKGPIARFKLITRNNNSVQVESNGDKFIWDYLRDD